MSIKNNSDSEKTFPIDFQPMPKRFMVWDKVDKNFVDNPSKACAITPFGALISQSDMIVCQSTNLFDKDGKEIFEGSIVEGEWSYNTGSTYLDFSVRGVVRNLNGVWCIAENNSDTDGKMLCELNPEDLNLVGHILSNPELLEGE